MHDATLTLAHGSAGQAQDHIFATGERSYRLLSELGRGGMGVVYLAERSDGELAHRVAIKQITALGATDPEVLSRFLVERQILARLDHPNLAKLLDAGTTREGAPYFVMEHIQGERIDQYCESRGLSTRERLRIFRAVCLAVHYAHQNLVVHRDLKPSNILVTGDGTPKLLDFGIAKLLDPEGDGAETLLGRQPMTPKYASPEQVRGEAVTTAADVYSLGVLLYKLLTGSHPYRLKSENPLELAQAICEQEPEKPSTALGRRQEATATAETLPAVHLPNRRQLRGDLDAIVLKAMRKEPGDRYASADEMAEDVRRHLGGLPVAARRGTLAYRAGKFLRRHKLSVAAALLFVGLTVGFAMSLKRQLDETEVERDKAQRTAAFLVDLFAVSDPGQSRGETITARELLDQGATKIRADASLAAEVRATLLETVGSVYTNLSLLDRAEPLLGEALELRRRARKDSIELAASLSRLGILQQQRGDYAAATGTFNEALAMERRLYGERHKDVAIGIENVATNLYYQADYAGAERLYRQVLEIRRAVLPPDHPHIAMSLANLGAVLHPLGRFAESEAAQREALALRRKVLPPDHPDIAVALLNLGFLLSDANRPAEAEVAYRESVAMMRKVFGAEHPLLATAITNLGGMLEDRGQLAEAEPLLLEGYAMRVKLLGDWHTDIANSLHCLGMLAFHKGDVVGAEDAFRKALDIWAVAKPADNPNATFPLQGLGTVLCDTGRAAEGEARLRRALELARTGLSAEQWVIPVAESELGACLTAQRRVAEAEALLAGAYPRLVEKLDAEHLWTRRAADHLAAVRHAIAQKR